MSATINPYGVYTVGEVAEILQIAPRHVARRINHGGLRARKIGKSWRISGQAILDFLYSDEGKKPTDQRNTMQTEKIVANDFKKKNIWLEEHERLLAVKRAVATSDSMSQAALKLADWGILTSRGQAWSKDSVRAALLRIEQIECREEAIN